MKRSISVLLLTLLIGCSTLFGPQTGADFLRKTALSVDAAMKSYAGYVIVANVPDSQQRSVRMAYGTYQATFAVATNAYWASIKSNNASLFTGPSNALVGAKSQLITATAH